VSGQLYDLMDFTSNKELPVLDG